MIRAERHERILDLVARHGAVGIVELSRLLAASSTTIRRDLADLDARRALQRTHGGGRLRDTGDEREFAAKLTSFLPEKRRIAAAAAGAIAPGLTIGCGGGTTMMQFATAIRQKTLSVVTTAINIALELAGAEDIEVLVTGGQLRKTSSEMVGHVAERTLRDVNLALAVISVDGLCPTAGLTTYNAAEAYVNRILIERARQTWILADPSKFGIVRPAVITPLSSATRVFTTPGATKGVLASIRRAGVEITVAR